MKSGYEAIHKEIYKAAIYKTTDKTTYGSIHQSIQHAVFQGLAALSLAGMLVGCADNAPSFSLLAEANSFHQTPSETNGKIDVLWVIDNSGSMLSSQQNVANNFASFIEKFNAKGYDYRMAVITTEAYRSLYSTTGDFAKFRDGLDLTSHTGIFVITPETTDVNATFLTNMMQGIKGSGDERAFQSIQTSLASADNAEFGFPRPDAFLSVILVSDEDDFSTDLSKSVSGQYSSPDLHTVDKYITYLDDLTKSTSDNRRYNVNSITILNQDCLDTLNAESPGRRIGLRYEELSEKTNGVIGSLCGNFAETLSSISNKILELSTQFPLSRQANPDSIRIWINDVFVPNDVTDGWTYNEENNSITFHGSFVPASGAKIVVVFDPVSIK